MHSAMHSAPAWANLSAVPVNAERALVIDRENGGWAFIPADSLPIARLLGVPAKDLPSDLSDQRNALAGELWDLRFGEPRRATPDDLNTLILKLTKACNYACTYCYDLEPEDKISHLSAETSIQAIREALELAPRQLGVILHGGEPTLLFPLIRQIVLAGERLAEELRREIVFLGQTNLSRLDQEMVDFFQEHRIRWGVSIDGPAEVNDRFRVMRNGGGTYRYFSAALERFPDFVRSCGIMSVITAHNDDALLSTARHFRGLGFSSWDWSLFHPIGQGRLQSEKFEFSTERLLESWAELFEAVEAGEFDGMRIRPVTSYLENFLLGPGRNMCMKRDCGAARDLLSVSSDGSIQACDCLDTKGPYADLGLIQIGGGSLRQARESDTAATIRSRDTTGGECGQCPWLAVCGGTCLAHAEDLNGVWLSQCRLAKLAFSSIAGSLAESDRLSRYWSSLGETTVAD